MAEPSRKSEGMEQLILRETGIDRRKTITEGGCTRCGASGLSVSSFKDAISFEEYCISGFCQKCQDDVFGMLKEMEDG